MTTTIHQQVIERFATELMHHLDANNYQHLCLFEGADMRHAKQLRTALGDAAHKANFAFAYADVRHTATTALETLSTALRPLVSEPLPTPDHPHPAVRFRRTFDAVLDRLDQRLLLVIDDIDSIHAVPKSGDALAALRSALIPRGARVHAIFFVQHPSVRSVVFRNDHHPMYLFAREIDVTAGLMRVAERGSP